RTCTERVRGCSHRSELAENRPHLPWGNTLPTTALDVGLGVFGARFGGAFTSQRARAGEGGRGRLPPGDRMFGSGEAYPPGRIHRSTCRSGTPLQRLLHGSMGNRFVRCTGCPQLVEAAMRWLVGWSSTAAEPVAVGTAGATGTDGETVQPVGSQLLWGDPDPLWAVGDWRPDEVRVVRADPQTRIAVLGTCGATDEQLRVALFAARGGALRHLTAWPGSYTAVVQVGRRVTVCGDLAGARPDFHTPWAGGTAYATAALPLADLVEANLDFGHLAALLAAPDVPAALYDSTPYDGVKRVPPGHALILRAGAREIAGYEPVASLAVAAPPADPDSAVDAVRDALVEAVRTRLAAPRHVPGASRAWDRPNAGRRAACRCPASGPTCPAARPPARSPCSPRDCPGCPAPCWGTAPGPGSGCSPSPSTTSWPAGRTRRSAGRAPWPPIRACTTWSSRAARRPCPTPTSTDR